MPNGYDNTRSVRRCKDCNKLLYVFEVGEFCIECSRKHAKTWSLPLQIRWMKKNYDRPRNTTKKTIPNASWSGKGISCLYVWKIPDPPLCDGSHAGSGLGPKVFKATEAVFVAFCGCKHSKDETGKCDGTHSSL